MRETFTATDVDSIRQAATRARGLRLLVLHGSRARADARPESDWDFGYLADATFDPDGMLAELAARLRADGIDLADLASASGQLRFRVARDGIVLHARDAGEWERFWLDAVSFWCDAAPVLDRAYDGVLSELIPMSALDRDVLAEKTQSVRRYLARVADRLPPDPAHFQPASDASDAVVLHLWQATQVVIDLALAACVQEKLGTPNGYADAFKRLQSAGIIDEALTDHLVRAAGFRNTVAHAYADLDMARVYRAASEGPADLLAFLARLRDRIVPTSAQRDEEPGSPPGSVRT